MSPAAHPSGRNATRENALASLVLTYLRHILLKNFASVWNTHDFPCNFLPPYGSCIVARKRANQIYITFTLAERPLP